MCDFYNNCMIIPNLVIITLKNYQVDSDDNNPLESNDGLFEDEKLN